MKPILLSVALLLVACTDEERSRRVLDQSGYTDIQITGYAWAECSDSDTYHTAFRAKGPSGKPVTGAVCCGTLKSCTVRIE